MKWFGKLTIEERIKICTIQNKWLVNLILQLHLITTTYDNVSFKPIYQMGNLFKDNKHFAHIDNNSYNNKSNLEQNNNNNNNNNDTNLINDLSFYENFFSIQYPEFAQSSSNFNNSGKKKMELEKEFNDLIRIISLSKEEELDTITLAKDILIDLDKFKNIFNFFSNEKYFQDWLLPIQINNTYNFVFPSWMHNINLTIFEIIAGYFEQQILLHYEYFYYSKKIYEYSYSDKIVGLYNENKNLSIFVKENYSTFDNPDTEKKEFISRMEIREIVQFVKNNKNIKPKIDYIYNLYEISFPTTIVVDNKFNNLLNSNLDSVINDDLYKEMINFGFNCRNGGTFNNGQMIFLSMKADNYTVCGEPFINYAVLSNAHNGTKPFALYFTDVRIVCLNTYMCATQAKNAVFSVRHTSKADWYIADFQYNGSMAKEISDYLKEYKK